MVVEASTETPGRHLVQPQNRLVWVGDPRSTGRTCSRSVKLESDIFGKIVLCNLVTKDTCCFISHSNQQMLSVTYTMI